jgi:hypothetical protein
MCERCGCAPCDCKQRDGGVKVAYNNGKMSQYQTPKERQIDRLATSILSQSQPFPVTLRGATLEEVEQFLMN